MPSDPVLHLSRDEILAIHERLVAQFGGLLGVGDLGYRDIAEMVAALFESLLMNHPFIVGNKRVAFFATFCQGGATSFRPRRLANQRIAGPLDIPPPFVAYVSVVVAGSREVS